MKIIFLYKTLIKKMSPITHFKYTKNKSILTFNLNSKMNINFNQFL